MKRDQVVLKRFEELSLKAEKIEETKDKTAYENYLVENLIALPIDQRYTKEDMIYIYEIISRFLK